MVTTLGWDIGGVNTKVACVRGGRLAEARSQPFEIQRDPSALSAVLRTLAAPCAAAGPVRHAVTMTAELSQAFRTKRDGVGAVLDAVEAAFGTAPVHVYGVDGRFRDPDTARREPFAVAAANWAATARLVARWHPTALIVDVGSTTTDVVPLVDGRLAAVGTTDPERLASGELVYTGMVRTAVEAMATALPFRDGQAAVSAEAFALAGDVYLWLGDLAPEDYLVTPPDGRPATRPFAGERLARAICADVELMDDAGLTRLAQACADSQTARIAAAIARVVTRAPGLRTAVVTGLGEAIAARAARCAGLEVVSLSATLGEAASRTAPAAAVALLLEEALGGGPDEPAPRRAPVPANAAAPAPAFDVVVKIGGGLFAHADALRAVVRTVRRLARQAPVLVVPGGGPFADAVRDADARLALTPVTSHWMAVLGMDQSAWLLADLAGDGTVVRSADEGRGVAAAGGLPVLAPSQWLRLADPLPHSWDVTSDSIAAWVAGAVGAPRLVLVKPPGASGSGLVDAAFGRVLPSSVTASCVPGDDLHALEGLLAPRSPSSASAAGPDPH